MKEELEGGEMKEGKMRVCPMLFADGQKRICQGNDCMWFMSSGPSGNGYCAIAVMAERSTMSDYDRQSAQFVSAPTRE